ncbi:GerAB/ArcD/ProY family transporter [Paenibacillus sp. 1P03SA]|uniref:GerAB/ArcD/ProY family transporter n=1 Tax=Paenibacillus sp. 1P03SA TaxID=3132294 RepID=UPI0039A1EA6C
MTKPSISGLQWFVILAVASIAMGPLRFPAYLSQQMDQHGWVLLLLALAISLWNTYVAVRLSSRHPRSDIGEWSRLYLGKFLSAVYVGCIAVYFFIWGDLTFGEHWLLVSYLQLKYTPVYTIVLLVMPVVLYMVWKGTEAWARLFLLLGFVMAVWLLSINLPQLRNMDVTNLLPLGNLGLPRLLGKNMLTIFYLFKGFAVLYFLYPYIRSDKNLLRLSAAATVTAGAEVMLSYLLPIMVFGYETAKTFTFPYQESMETVPFLLLPFEKLSFLAPLFFVLVNIMILIVCVTCCSQALCRLFNTRRIKRMYVIVSVLMSLAFLRTLTVNEVDRLVYITALVFGIIFVLIPNYMWIVSLFRKEKTG